MTNTESRNGVGLDDPASWDDTAEHNEQPTTDADGRALTVYGFDSDHRTLVGLGPVERARRSRRAAEVPESQRMPPSEPPGPFVAGDDELPSALRRRKLSPWAVAVPAFLIVVFAAVIGLRGPAPVPTHAEAASQPAAAQPSHDTPEPHAALVSPPADVTPPADATPPADVAPPADVTPPATVTAKVDTASVAQTVVDPAHLRAGVPAVPSALPVKLSDLPPPSTVELSSAGDRSAGTINVTSSPPANVVLDGRPLGKAPRIARVPAGVHTVVLIHPLYGRKSLSVNVVPGMTARASAEF